LVIAETLRHFSIFTVAKVESKELVSLGLLTQLLEIEESGVDGDGEALRLANNIPQTTLHKRPWAIRLKNYELTPSAGELEHSTTPCLLLHTF